MWPPRITLTQTTNAQNWLVAAILGAGPGVYLAITGLGAGAGQSESARFSQIQNCLGNGIYGLVSFLAPLLLRYASVRWFMIIGPTGYACYIAGLIYFQARNDIIFPLILSVYFGFGSALVWVGTTYISIAYSTISSKGHFVNNQWIGLSLGSTVGAAVALGANYNRDKAAGVSYGVLGAWMAIHVTASIVAYFLVLPAYRVRSADGKEIPAGRDIMGNTSPAMVIKEIGMTFMQPKILLVFIAMFTSDFWLIFIGRWNSRNFSLRARSLNTFLYWVIQIPTAAALSRLLDRKSWTPQQRGLYGFATLTIVVTASWVGFLTWQNIHIESADPLNRAFQVIDWNDSRYAGGLVVYLIFGLSYPTYHVVLVFYMSMLSNEGDRKMSYYAGIFKGLQALGIAFAFGIGSTNPNYLTEGACYAGTSLFFLGPLGYAFWHYLSPNHPSELADLVDIGSVGLEETDDRDGKKRPEVNQPAVEAV